MNEACQSTHSKAVSLRSFFVIKSFITVYLYHKGSLLQDNAPKWNTSIVYFVHSETKKMHVHLCWFLYSKCNLERILPCILLHL